MKAKNALEELTNQMESSIPCLRDGKTESLPVSKLVPGASKHPPPFQPALVRESDLLLGALSGSQKSFCRSAGDVIHLRGGALTPADVEWLEGDTLSIDTAALTGEPLPRKYPSEEYGKMILSGTTVKSGEAYCIVRLTGTNTEIGQGQADIMADRATAAVSVFEQRVMVVVNIIISVAVLDGIIIVLVQGLVRNGFDVEARLRPSPRIGNLAPAFTKPHHELAQLVLSASANNGAWGDGLGLWPRVVDLLRGQVLEEMTRLASARDFSET